MTNQELIHLIKVHQMFAELVAGKHIKSAIIDGEVVYWFDEECIDYDGGPYSNPDCHK